MIQKGSLGGNVGLVREVVSLTDGWQDKCQSEVRLARGTEIPSSYDIKPSHERMYT